MYCCRTGFNCIGRTSVCLHFSIFKCYAYLSAITVNWEIFVFVFKIFSYGLLAYEKFSTTNIYGMISETKDQQRQGTSRLPGVDLRSIF